MMSLKFPLLFHHISTFNLRAAVSLPACGKCNSALPHRDGVKCHSYQNRKWCDCCLSRNWEEEWDFCTEHKPAGRKPHFYHSFNFDFLSGEVPSLPFRWLAVSLVPFSGFRTIPSLCPTKTNSIVLHAMTVKHLNCLPQQMTTAMLQLAPGHRDHGGKMWSILSWQMLKCDCSVERLFIDRVDKLQDA